MKKEIIKFVFLVLVALGAGPAGAAFWQWSKTASSNATADPSINWAEGMPPSAVNDSARAMMARLAEQGADTSGQLVAAGGPTAYTVTTNQGFPNPPQDGQVIGITFAVSNGSNPTLAVDGGAAYPINYQTGSAAPAGTLLVGTPYTMKYYASTSAWRLRNYYGGEQDIVPIGGLVAFTGTVVPNSNWVFANGQCISTTTYAAYWSIMGSPAPGSCSAGQFAVLDLRGRVPAGLDNLGGAAAAGRLSSNSYGCGTAATSVGAACTATEYHYMALAELVTHAHNAYMYDPNHHHAIAFSDPGHYHAAQLSDPGHVHAAGIYDPGHSHTGPSGRFLWGQYNGTNNDQGVGPGVTGSAASSTAGSYTSALVNGGANGNNNVYLAGTGATIWSSSYGNNTTYLNYTGGYVGGANGNNLTNDSGTGVRVHSSTYGYDATESAGSTYPFTVVQPTIVVNYIIRVQ